MKKMIMIQVMSTIGAICMPTSSTILRLIFIM
jgi:hypothetical protein